ncbi:hypothetical protein BH23GEM7_BH23GEM7_29720 [soil metagenome]|jgi:hypothetical protein|nr:hypothetical protein [Gemmatimonadota bacterium]
MRLIFALLRHLLALAGLAALIEKLFGRPIDWLPPRPPEVDRWLECERGSGDSCTRTIGYAGGTIEVNGHILTIPEGAVDRGRNIQFTLREAATRQLLVIVTAAGPFKGTVDLTLSYARCREKLPPPGTRLAVWRFRTQDGWQFLGGEVDSRTLTITVRNTGISRFAIAEQ